jgi:hypothetical protein
VGLGEGVGDDEDGVLGVGVGVELGAGEGVGDDEDGVLGVGVGVELGAGEGVGDPPSVPEGSLLDKFIPDMTYATRNTSKQAHTNKTINNLLPIFHFN